MGKFSYVTGAKMLGLAILVGMLSLGIGNNPGWSFGCNNIGKVYAFKEPQSTLTSLKNLGWLTYLARGKMDNPDKKSVFPSPKTDSAAITSKMEITMLLFTATKEQKFLLT